MFYNARNGKIDISGAIMDYICFGYGKKHLIMIPGLGDGLRTVKGLALPMAVMYKEFTKEYTVWVFSRKQPLEDDCTTRTMARDMKAAMDILGIGKADVLGVSQGGMIAQWLAVDYSDCINRLVLAVTAPGPNRTIQSAINTWLDCIERSDFRTFVTDNFEKTYSENYLKKYRPLYPFVVPFMKPADPARFILQANACLTHDASDFIGGINCPVLVVAGRQDKIVTCRASVEMAEKIKDSRLIIYDDYGHALYEEAKDFNSRVLEFLTKNN